jgi:hypothetical protein
MRRKDEEALRTSLRRAIQAWWESEELDTIERPYIGDNTIVIMADAAVTVLVALDDVYETLRSNGELIESK